MVFILSVPMAGETRSQGNADPVRAMVGVLMSKYYENPAGTNVKGLLKAWETSTNPNDKNSIPPIAGFLTGLFIKYPEKIDSFIDENSSPRMQFVIGTALRLAGHLHALKNYAKKWNWSPDQLAQASSGPTLLAMTANTPTDFDLNWGASFATGEARFVRKVYDAYVRVTETPGIVTSDLVAVANFHRKRINQDEVKNIFQKYKSENRIALIYGSTALWALESNANQHAFINKLIKTWLNEKPQSNAAKGYRASAGK